MSMDIPTTASAIADVSTLQANQRKRNLFLFLVIFIILVCLTPLLILAGTAISFGLVLSGLVLLIVAGLIIRWPIIGFFLATGCAILIEQNPLKTPIVTDELNVFYWPPEFAGQVERPFGYLLLFIFLVQICHNLLKHKQPLQGGKFLLPLLCFLSCVVIGIVHGLASGGIFKIITLEIRPFWYLFLSYLLAYNLITRRSHIRAFFWIVIVAAGVKALQGIYIYLVALHGNLSSNRDIMAHEESFFFVALLLLVVLFCIHYCYRPQFYASLLVVLPVLIALVANQRRTDYLALLSGIVVAWVLIFCVKPHARKALLVGMLISVIVTGGYVAAFSNSTGGIAEPARAIVSIFRPDQQDAASNLYRVEEDYDLKYTMKQSPLIGFGFGKPFFEPILLPDLYTGDPAFGGNPFQYVPHNTIYWVWMRLGGLGFFVLWYLFGVIIIRGCLIARQLQNRYLQLVAIYIVAVTFMEVFVAYSDYQLYTYRTVIYLGLLMGLLLKLPTLDERKQTMIDSAAARTSLHSVDLVGVRDGNR
jgi:O-antigen ligase